jgi:hypothetical protein
MEDIIRTLIKNRDLSADEKAKIIFHTVTISARADKDLKSSNPLVQSIINEARRNSK